MTNANIANPVISTILIVEYRLKSKLKSNMNIYITGIKIMKSKELFLLLVKPVISSVLAIVLKKVSFVKKFCIV
jgi:hypothetical protein